VPQEKVLDQNRIESKSQLTLVPCQGLPGGGRSSVSFKAFVSPAYSRFHPLQIFEHIGTENPDNSSRRVNSSNIFHVHQWADLGGLNEHNHLHKNRRAGVAVGDVERD
jgi:hypothetical protein